MLNKHTKINFEWFCSVVVVYFIWCPVQQKKGKNKVEMSSNQINNNQIIDEAEKTQQQYSKEKLKPQPILSIFI